MTTKAEAAEDRYRQLVHEIATRLRRSADRIDAQATPREDIQTLRANYPRAARSILSEVLWTVANAHLDLLQSVAEELDRVMAEAEQ